MPLGHETLKVIISQLGAQLLEVVPRHGPMLRQHHGARALVAPEPAQPTPSVPAGPRRPAKRAGQRRAAAAIALPAGIAGAGAAGRLKELDLSAQDKTGEFSLTKGLLLSLLAGVLSAVYGFSLEAGEPIADIARVVKEAGALLHTDAVAAAGTIPVDVKRLGVDALSLAANVFYGPRGAGALWVKKGVRVLPLLDGGVQEAGRRPGTENVPAIVGMGLAAHLAESNLAPRMKLVGALRDRLISGLLSSLDHVTLSGHPARRLPGAASVLVEFIEGESMLMLMNQKGIAASSGSACTSRALKASHVLTAMGIPPERAHGSLLFSLGIQNTEEDVDQVVAALPPIVGTLRKMSPLYDKFVKGERGGD